MERMLWEERLSLIGDRVIQMIFPFGCQFQSESDRGFSLVEKQMVMELFFHHMADAQRGCLWSYPHIGPHASRKPGEQIFKRIIFGILKDTPSIGQGG